jgi:hypothetical protein
MPPKRFVPLVGFVGSAFLSALKDLPPCQVHKEVFNVKGEVVIPDCPSHEALFSGDHAMAAAAAIARFLAKRVAKEAALFGSLRENGG